MKTAENFAKFAQQALTSGTGYVYGALGQICTTALLDQKARQYPDDNLAGGTMRRVGNKWIGKRVTDCIGLLKWYLMTNKYGDDPHYIAAYDHGANQHYQEAREKGPMSTLPEIPGICLHMDGHFGVYVGNGWAIEARGTYYGVVKTRVANRPWTAWFKSIWLDYSASAPSYVCDTSGTVAIARGTAYQVEITAGDTPQVVAGTADVVTVLPRSSSGDKWYYYIVPIGRPGDKVGVYINGNKCQFIAEIK